MPADESAVGFNVGKVRKILAFVMKWIPCFMSVPVDIRLTVRDEDGKLTTGMFEIRDAWGGYPRGQAPGTRFFFSPPDLSCRWRVHPLPEGRYDVTFARGPESIPQKRQLVVDGQTQSWHFEVQR